MGVVWRRVGGVERESGCGEENGRCVERESGCGRCGEGSGWGRENGRCV